MTDRKPAGPKPADDIEIFQTGLYALAFFYILIVTLNALSILICFWIKSAGGFPALDWKSLFGWAVGTGGLGAGSLIFRPIVNRLIQRKNSN